MRTRARTGTWPPGRWPCWPTCSPRRATCATASSKWRPTSATWPPSSYITNAAGFSAADFLRRVTTIAYRTRELQVAWPDSGSGSAERSHWEGHPAWQPARKAVEYALASYDWGEAFTALNLVLGPTLDDVLRTQLGQVARANGDDPTWLLSTFLAADAQRRGRWSHRLAEFAITQRAANRDVLGRWVTRWSALADDAALGLGEFLESLPERGRAASEVAAMRARPVRGSWRRFLPRRRGGR